MAQAKEETDIFNCLKTARATTEPWRGWWWWWFPEVTLSWNLERKSTPFQKISPQEFAVRFCFSYKVSFQQGNSKADNQKTAAAGLKSKCSVCMALMPDPKTYRQVTLQS